MQEIMDEQYIKHNAISEKQQRFMENVIAIILFYAMINSMAACLFEFNAQLARVARYGLYIIESALIGYALLLSLQRIPRMIIAAYCATAAIFLLTVCFYPANRFVILEYTKHMFVFCIPCLFLPSVIGSKSHLLETLTKWSYPMIIMGILYASLAHAASTYEMWFGYQLLVPTMLISRRIIKARHQWFDYLFFIVGVYLITVVGSRGPLLIVGVYLVVSFVMRIRECKKIPVNANLKDYLKNEKTYVIMSVLLLFGLFILIIGIVWIKPISSAIYSALAQSGIESRTLRVLSERGLLFLSGRGEIYEEAIKAIGNRPWLGYGIGGDCVYIGSIVYGYPPETSIGTYPHNLVLELLMQYGIPAGFFILSVFIAITKRGIYAVKKESTDQKDIYYVFLTIAFVSLLFSGTYLNSKYLWMLFGLAISFCRTHRSRAIGTNDAAQGNC